MKNEETTRVDNLDHLTEDSRAECLRQGKACVYDELGSIVTEWPNGTRDRLETATGVRTRTWPDGATERLAADEPVAFPHWPRAEAEAAGRCRG